MPDELEARVEADRRLLEALRAAARVHDPIPAGVQHMARDSFVWRTIDAELADLAYDSALDDDRLAGVRGTDAGPRALTFEGPRLTVELEVVEVGDQRRLLGQLVPPRGADIEIRSADVEVQSARGAFVVVADEIGRFTAEVETGLVSLRCKFPGDDGPALETAWIMV
jgi:hypothetical protein